MITMENVVTVSDSVWAHVGGTKNLGTLGQFKIGTYSFASVLSFSSRVFSVTLS